MQLVMDVEGASPEELARGLAAAQAVFAAAAVTPYEAARGFFDRKSWDDQGFPEETMPSDKAMDAADAWEDAQHAADKACCRRWSAVPTTAQVALTFDDAERANPR